MYTCAINEKKIDIDLITSFLLSIFRTIMEAKAMCLIKD